MQEFESLPGEKPFAKLKAADLRLVKIQSVVFDPISWLGGKIQTDTEVSRTRAVDVSEHDSQSGIAYYIQ